MLAKTETRPYLRNNQNQVGDYRVILHNELHYTRLTWINGIKPSSILLCLWYSTITHQILSVTNILSQVLYLSIILTLEPPWGKSYLSIAVFQMYIINLAYNIQVF